MLDGDADDKDDDADDNGRDGSIDDEVVTANGEDVVDVIDAVVEVNTYGLLEF